MTSHTDLPLYLVVGAGPGIGLATARRFAANGWQVVFIGTDASSLTEVANQLAASTPAAPPAITCVADASDPTGLRTALINLELPRVDVAHYNVSMWVPGALDANLTNVTTGMNSGVVSALAMVQAVAVGMMERKSGAIVFTGSGAADIPAAASLGLGMQKAALRNLAIGLQPVLAESSIRVLHLTIYGVLAADSPFSPANIAARIEGLVIATDGSGAAALGPNEQWDPVVPFHGEPAPAN